MLNIIGPICLPIMYLESICTNHLIFWRIGVLSRLIRFFPKTVHIIFSTDKRVKLINVTILLTLTQEKNSSGKNACQNRIEFQESS